MQKFGIIVTVSLISLIAVCCGPSIRAPKLGGGRKVLLQVYVDRGLEGKTPDQQNQHNQLGEYMELNLREMAADFGYETQQIASPDAFTPGDATYLLSIKVVNYNPGSKAARLLVGFGAGSASLDTHYDLIATDHQAIFSKDHGRASSKDWRNICRRLNKDMLIAISEKLHTVVH